MEDFLDTFDISSIDFENGFSIYEPLIGDAVQRHIYEIFVDNQRFVRKEKIENILNNI